MTRSLQAAAEIQDFLSQQGWKFCFVGDVAFLRWGEPPPTREIDISVCTGIGHEDQFLSRVLTKYRARIAEDHDLARRNRVLRLQTNDGVPFDVSLAGLPVEDRIIERASPHRFPRSIDLLTCSAEDLIVLLAFSDRPQDRIDASRVVMRHQSDLDWDLIERELKPLVEQTEGHAMWDWLNRLRQQPEG